MRGSGVPSLQGLAGRPGRGGALALLCPDALVIACLLWLALPFSHAFLYGETGLTRAGNLTAC